ncbi:YnfC family lipoprotein, partial [Shigella boydii]|uniref:YnfC family lipoprotein n=1 Tax=Shigella boydii TaxID=621 RepID=UPI0020C61531
KRVFLVILFTSFSGSLVSRISGAVQVGNVKQSCEYDSHANPVDCQLIIVDEGVKPAVERVYTIKNTIDYY